MSNPICVHLADLRDPNDSAGRSYRQVNLAKQHGIPVGTLVEYVEDGVRLFVVKQGRDCDGTPLYYLCHDPDDTVQRREGFSNPHWIGGYPEHVLRVVAYKGIVIEET